MKVALLIREVPAVLLIFRNTGQGSDRPCSAWMGRASYSAPMSTSPHQRTARCSRSDRSGLVRRNRGSG